MNVRSLSSPTEVGTAAVKLLLSIGTTRIDPDRAFEIRIRPLRRHAATSLLGWDGIGCTGPIRLCSIESWFWLRLACASTSINGAAKPISKRRPPARRVDTGFHRRQSRLLRKTLGIIAIHAPTSRSPNSSGSWRAVPRNGAIFQEGIHIGL
jgi:hypothetical protein